MTKYRDKILLYLLLSKRAKLTEIVGHVHSDKQIEQHYILIICKRCGGKYLKEEKKYENIGADYSQKDIAKINASRIAPFFGRRCSHCGATLLPRRGKKKYCFKTLKIMPYKKRKYLGANLKRTDLDPLEKEGLIYSKKDVYYLKEKVFYKKVLQSLFKETANFNTDIFMENSFEIGKVLVGRFYKRYNQRIENFSLKIKDFDGLIFEIINSLTSVSIAEIIKRIKVSPPEKKEIIANQLEMFGELVKQNLPDFSSIRSDSMVGEDDSFD